MPKLRISQNEMLSQAIDFMTEILWNSIQKAQKDNPNTFAAIRYTDEEKYDNYRRAQRVWGKMQDAPEEERVAFLQELGVEGSKYKHASNNHNMEDDETYIFFFPAKNKSTLRLCLQSIMETKAEDPEARNKNFFAGAFLLSNDIKEKYTNPHDKASGMGGGDYTVGGKLVHLEELALNTRDFNPDSLITSSITEDIYLQSMYVADSREIDPTRIDTLREYAVNDNFTIIRDFCDFIAVEHGIDFEEKRIELDAKELSKKFKLPLDDVESILGMQETLAHASKDDKKAVRDFYHSTGMGACYDYVCSAGSQKPAAQEDTYAQESDQSDDYTQ